jgi:HlyD family secretion protein
MPTTTIPAADKPGEAKPSPSACRWRRTGLKILAVAALAGLIVYKLKFSPVPVSAHQVALGSVVAEVMGTGTLEARVKTTISPRIQERLAEVLVDQGDYVKSGQLLARLDDAETKQQVAIAEATLAAARATVERVRSDEARAQAVLKQAQQDHQRSIELLAGKITSQSDFDKTAEALHVAEAELKRAQSAIVEAESQVFTAEKTLLYQKEHLAFTEMRSPYDGLVTRRDRDPGGIVVPGASILQLVATNEIWVSAWVDETAMTGLKAGQPARVVFRSEPAQSYAGEVARLGREADRETREFVIDVRVKELPENWMIGQRAEVFIETGHKSGVLVLPPQFICWSANKSGVFVNDHGHARWHGVTLGLRGLQNVEVTQGLSAGEQIVRPVEGQKQPLNDGQRIKAK